MLLIILLERKLLNFKINWYYFYENSQQDKPFAHIDSYSHSDYSSELSEVQTSWIDLTKDQEDIFLEFRPTNRKQIRRAEKKEFVIERLNKPTLDDMKDFQLYYNNFAKTVNTYSCNAFHVDTMKKLSENNSLVISKVLSHKRDILGYRVYVTDGNKSMSLYSASFFREKNNEEKKMLSEASRYHIWQDILYFKNENHKTYDMGGLTNNENIKNFKLEFGGEIVNVYSGYKANTWIGRAILGLRRIYMRKG